MGKTQNAEISKSKEHYEVIFKTKEGKFSSFYIQNTATDNDDGFLALKKAVFTLFKNPNKKDYLLQFLEDSVFLVYKDSKVKMEVWKGHDSDRREASLWLSYKAYLKLFGLVPQKNNF
ncbi:hypothetical protein [Mesonia aestuariivivens]|uniref:Uncharacterized protein n=1 Tax=Mesonia aestuariivivens TaxID=2796128 RepID=A0ABS6W5V6_9FLAO|nr:hypothetical protein [Mesonia aestuariivivens]MBW2962912.1 hypothetical protein [Mesonia aestuariivivens]